MQSITRIAVSMFLVAKLRRDGILNLYPFPRVGRASAQTWQVPLNDFYLDYPVGEHSEPEHIDPELNEDRKKRQANQ
ncbi:hypothetical protein MSG28_009212 [Choristoneura fumiferana]|uniref:Uncharacterized protein n=1 Tax=Choristoneura fumiferana TaxID=7141 RepID=A0ACC0KWJ6_CHOFU|nr:hypothetical protein MSG28_009212 [Choristoneura fumiferana]